MLQKCTHAYADWPAARVVWCRLIADRLVLVGQWEVATLEGDLFSCRERVRPGGRDGADELDVLEDAVLEQDAHDRRG